MNRRTLSRLLIICLLGMNLHDIYTIFADAFLLERFVESYEIDLRLLTLTTIFIKFSFLVIGFQLLGFKEKARLWVLALLAFDAMHLVIGILIYSQEYDLTARDLNLIALGLVMDIFFFVYFSLAYVRDQFE